MEELLTPESSNISKIKYFDDSETLEVEFKNGGVYEYFDVPHTIWESFKNSESKGKFLAQSVKGKYRFSKI